jgi:hypothetical protein
VKGTRLVTPALLAAVLFAFAFAGAGAACGDDKKGGPSSTPAGGPLSKEEYLARAREICQTGNQVLTAASDAAVAKLPPGQKLSLPDIEKFVRETVVPKIRDQVRQLRALKAPKGDRAHVDEIYGELDKGLDELEKTPSKLTDGSNVYATADPRAQKYGISVCATTG